MAPRVLPAFLLLLLLVAFQPVAVAARKRSVVFYQDPPTMDTVVTGNLKLYIYHAVLRTVKDGPIVGRLYGQTQFDEALFVGAQIETRARNLVFEFTGDAGAGFNKKIVPLGQVTASGVVSYADDSFFLQVGRPVTVPVTGGSHGWYKATGQVTSTRLDAAGAHTHHFEIEHSTYKPRKQQA